ncbi:type IV secretory system conjugative DNA transfer family protein [Candidatus Berkelbacteria bacterium]|nr:type IV secretory system conjugative DNA transfer family protein [Candidatus Berkelbacteria bacterium]
MTGFAFLLLILGLAGAGGWLWLDRYRERLGSERARDLVLLKVLVPKESGESQDETGKRDFRETMSVAEQFLASFASLHKEGLLEWIPGQPTISLEFVAKNGLLTFYIAVPKAFRELAERQLHSYYPYAQIEPSEAFRIFSETVYPEGMYVKTKKTYVLPIKTYKELESDPLNAITNAFSKLPDGVNAGFQLLLRPTSGAWRDKTVHAAKSVAQGKNLTKSHWALQALNAVVSSLRSGGAAAEEKEKEKETVRLTPIQEEVMKGIQEKGSKVGFSAQLRVIVLSPTSTNEAKIALDNIASSLGQYTAPEMNYLKKVGATDAKQFATDFILRRFRERAPSSILNTEELASLYHVPNEFIETPNIEWLAARTMAPPSNLPPEDPNAVILGKSVYRGEERPVRIKQDDRRRHLYSIGKTGVGKTTLFIHQIEQDIKAGRGVAYLDPNGDAIESILTIIPKERAEDVVLFDPADLERPMGLNVLEWKRLEDRDFLVAEWLEIFYKLFDPNRTGMVGPQFEHWGRNASLSVMARPGGGTLIDIPRLFTDDAFRDDTLRYVTDPVVKAFWEQQMAKTADFHKSEMYNYFISKFGRFMTNDLIRNIIGQTKSAFDIRELMDGHKIFLVNLSKGKIGETNSHLLGMILVAKMQVAAFQRADTPEADRKDFYLYVDEFQNFTTDTFKTILSEARKYRLNLNITNQYIAQLPEEIRDAVIGNAGTLISMRVGAADAEFLEKEFPNVTEHDLVNLPFASSYTKLLIDGTPTKPFSMMTIKTATPPNAELGAAIRELSRLKYGKEKRQVEQEMEQRYQAKNPFAPDNLHIPDVPPGREG